MINDGIWVRDPVRIIPPLRLDYSKGDGMDKYYDSLSRIDERKHRAILAYFVFWFVFITGLIIISSLYA